MPAQNPTFPTLVQVAEEAPKLAGAWGAGAGRNRLVLDRWGLGIAAPPCWWYAHPGETGSPLALQWRLGVWARQLLFAVPPAKTDGCDNRVIPVRMQCSRLSCPRRVSGHAVPRCPGTSHRLVRVTHQRTMTLARNKIGDELLDFVTGVCKFDAVKFGRISTSRVSLADASAPYTNTHNMQPGQKCASGMVLATDCQARTATTGNLRCAAGHRS